MDRIWKGQSMLINQEGSNIIASPMLTGDNLDRQDDLHHHSTTHGSSKTYFVVQALAHGQNSSGQQNGVTSPLTFGVIWKSRISKRLEVNSFFPYKTNHSV
jgi:hypothetical protein